MPEAGRLGDQSHIQADGHGCPACPHSATGPAVGGSANVAINGRPALRVGDPGLHAGCCGTNAWRATQGAPGVFINNRAAHRMGDEDAHCGGVGKLVEGSCNVLIGDHNGRRGRPREEPAWIQIEFVNDSGHPVRGVKKLVTLTDGTEVKAVTGDDGVLRWDSIPHGIVTIRSHDAE
jgi:uncharacterized Zn-binding protein involved in type VI secretion